MAKETEAKPANQPQMFNLKQAQDIFETGSAEDIEKLKTNMLQMLKDSGAQTFSNPPPENLRRDIVDESGAPLNMSDAAIRERLAKGTGAAIREREAKEIEPKIKRKKQNVGKALSDKSLEELYNGRTVLQGNIDMLQSALARDAGQELRQKYGSQLEAHIKLFDRINKEIEVKEMDVEEDMNLDGEPSPYDEEALKEALATGGKVEAPDWVIDALLEDLPSGTVEAGPAKVVSSPKGGETPTEAVGSWGKEIEDAEAVEAGHDLKEAAAQKAIDNLSRWGIEVARNAPSGARYAPYERQDLGIVKANEILGLASRGVITLDPKLERDLRGVVALGRQEDQAYEEMWDYKGSVPETDVTSAYHTKSRAQRRKQDVKEEFPEAKKKAE